MSQPLPITEALIHLLFFLVLVHRGVGVSWVWEMAQWVYQKTEAQDCQWKAMSQKDAGTDGEGSTRLAQ